MTGKGRLGDKLPETVLGITGEIGAGKDTVGDYLQEEYGFEKLSYGDAAREIAEEEGVKPDRENLQEIGENQGEEIHEKVYEMIEKCQAERYVLVGVREPWQEEDLRQEFGDSFRLVYVTARGWLRFLRLKERGEERDPEYYKDFKEQDDFGRELHNLEETFGESDFEIKNNRSEDYIKERADEILEALD